MKIEKVVALLLGIISLLFAETIILQNSGDKIVCEDTYMEETINEPFSEKKSLEAEVGT